MGFESLLTVKRQIQTDNYLTGNNLYHNKRVNYRLLNILKPLKQYTHDSNMIQHSTTVLGRGNITFTFNTHENKAKDEKR